MRPFCARVRPFCARVRPRDATPADALKSRFTIGRMDSLETLAGRLGFPRNWLRREAGSGLRPALFEQIIRQLVRVVLAVLGDRLARWRTMYLFLRWQAERGKRKCR